MLSLLRCRNRRWRTAAGLSLAVLLTTAVVWVWAHEGHQALPTRGVTVDIAKGSINLSPDSRAALGVQTAEATLQPVDERVLAPATVVAPWQRHAYGTTRLGGKIAAVHVKEGQQVRAGQPLADVESLELENLQLELRTAANDARLSAENLRQLESAGERGAVSEQHLLEARAKHQENLNAVELGRRKLLGLGVAPAAIEPLVQGPSAPSLPVLPITSPIRGVVIHADILVGQVVEPADHLFELIDLAQVWVRLGVLEKDLYRVQAGQPFELRLTAYPQPDVVFRGAVQGRGMALNPQTLLGTAWALLPNPDGRLLPGMFGQVQVSSQVTKDALMIPATALVSDGLDHYVFLEEGPGQYSKQNVVVGRRTRGLVQVLSGRLVPGDRVVTAGSHELASSFVPGVLRPSPEAVKNFGLRVEPARKQRVADVLDLNGVLELPPDRRAIASARLAGTLHRIRVDRDQPVRAGDVIAEVASLELQNLQLELLSSHLKAGILEQTLSRLDPLKAGSAVSSRQLREAQSAYHAALQRRDSLQRKLLAVGLSAEQVQAVRDRGQFVEALSVRAPIDGVVVRFHGVLGQAVKAEAPLFEIHDLNHVAIRGHVFERQLQGVTLGQRARVRLAADADFLAEARVLRSGQVFGSDDRTLSVWAEFETKPQRLLQPGMLARLSLIRGEREATLAVPRPTVQQEGTHAFLFVQQADGVFERRLVGTGRADDRFVEITHGLQEGERVAVHGAAELQTAYASLR
jgi:RND family efflux transporter MFP subunit